jgi:hypothetical protein
MVQKHQVNRETVMVFVNPRKDLNGGALQTVEAMDGLIMMEMSGFLRGLVAKRMVVLTGTFKGRVEDMTMYILAGKRVR